MNSIRVQKVKMSLEG